MTDLVRNRHDSLFKVILSDRDRANSVIRSYIDPQVLPLLAPGRHTPLEGSFIDANLRSHQVDRLSAAATPPSCISCSNTSRRLYLEAQQAHPVALDCCRRQAVAPSGPDIAPESHATLAWPSFHAAPFGYTGNFREGCFLDSPKSVLLLKPRGFCAGVVRAIDIVELSLATYGPPIYVRKEIVHNLHVVNDLASRGAIFVDDVDDVPRGERLIYSAHGVAPSVRRMAEARDLQVIDATCPLVTKVHMEAIRFAKAQRTILLIGHKNHDEVVGTIGEAPDRMIVVSDVADAEALEIPDGDVAYLTQTTLSVSEAASVIEVLKRRMPHIKGPPSQDICYATENRQQSVVHIAQQADLLLVVGSQNSSNSQRMVEVGKQAGLAGRLIDDETDIQPQWLEGVRHIAVSAGASAPESLVQRVVQHLQSVGFENVTEVETVPEDVSFPLPPELRAAQGLTQIAVPQ